MSRIWVSLLPVSGYLSLATHQQGSALNSSSEICLIENTRQEEAEKAQHQWRPSAKPAADPWLANQSMFWQVRNSNLDGNGTSGKGLSPAALPWSPCATSGCLFDKTLDDASSIATKMRTIALLVLTKGSWIAPKIHSGVCNFLLRI